jgi:hypothetical protein
MSGLTCDYCDLPLPEPEKIKWYFWPSKEKARMSTDDGAYAIGMYCCDKCLKYDPDEKRTERLHRAQSERDRARDIQVAPEIKTNVNQVGNADMYLNRAPSPFLLPAQEMYTRNEYDFRKYYGMDRNIKRRTKKRKVEDDNG